MMRALFILLFSLPFCAHADLPKKLDHLFKRVTSDSNAQAPINDIWSFNQRDRDAWIIAQAESVPLGSSVLDVGAGTCPYRHLFDHCNYVTQDFALYTGEKLGETTEYGDIDIRSDILEIPVEDGSFDLILCTEVFEHIPYPIAAVKELSRILKPGGRLLLTAPFACGLHQLPFHYYTGFTPEWYRKILTEAGFEIIEITPNGGFFKMLSQECARVYWHWDEIQDDFYAKDRAVLERLFKEFLPRLLYDLDERHFIDQFTVGYHVQAVKL